MQFASFHGVNTPTTSDLEHCVMPLSTEWGGDPCGWSALAWN